MHVPDPQTIRSHSVPSTCPPQGRERPTTWLLALAVAVYSMLYLFAIYVGAIAFGAGDTLSGTGLFATSTGLLLAVQREFRHAAQLLQIRQHRDHDPGPAAGLVVSDHVTALLPDCSCETWWTSLGGAHDPQCPAHSSGSAR